MKKSAMPEVKFKKRPDPTDAEIIETLRKSNRQLTDKVDELRDMLEERDARITELENEVRSLFRHNESLQNELYKLQDTPGVPF